MNECHETKFLLLLFDINIFKKYGWNFIWEFLSKCI